MQAKRRTLDKQADPNTPKSCSKCKAPLRLCDFYPGVSWCKECQSTFAFDIRVSHPQRKLLEGALYRSKRDNIPFNITEADIVIPVLCPDTGLTLALARGSVKPNSPTLDKIIPELGYVRGNVRVISSLSNRMKQEATLLQMATTWSNVLEAVPPQYKLNDETKSALCRLMESITKALAR